MNQALISQLQSPDPAQRRQAIIALGRAKDRRALQALAHIYRSDPLPELRELAYKAGRYITQQTQPPQPAPSRPQPPALYDPDASQDADYSRLPVDTSYGVGLSRTAPISSQAIDRARRYYDHALHLLVKKKPEQAASELARALEVNPDLINDPPTRNLAAEILGVQPEEAIQIINDPVRRQLYVGGGGGQHGSQWAARKPKGKRGAAPTQAATWNDVNIDLAIMFVVTVIVIMIVNVLANAGLPGEYQEPITSILIRAAAFAGFMMIATLISNGAVHLMVKFFIGEAPLVETFHTLIPIQTALLAVFYGSLVLPYLDPNAACASPLLAMSMLGSGTYWMAQRLGELHNIGTWQGCAALIIGPIILVVLAAVGLLLIFGPLLSAFMPATY